MGRCRTCKHWKIREEMPFGECSNEHMNYGYTFEISDISLDCVLIEDDEGWGMLTGPEFGCVHYDGPSVA